jgi:hypothetical protein
MTTKQEPLAEELLATNELNRFCKEFGLSVEIDKLSDSTGHLTYRVADEKGKTIKQIIIEEKNITYFEDNIEEYAGTLLNKVSQIYPK